MPRVAIDYSKTVIYKIVCNDLNIKYTYVGHTTDFTNRKRSHKQSCYCETSKEYNKKVYQAIRENGGWANWTIMIIEQFPCLNAIEACIRERFWYTELNADLNSRSPFRTAEEKLEYEKNYYNNNKDKINQYKETNKENISARHKQYHEDNKVSIASQRKQFREDNKEKISLQRKQKYKEKKAKKAQTLIP